MKPLTVRLRPIAPFVLLMGLATLTAPLAASDDSSHARVVAEITALLNAFIEGSDQAQQHARFWADDLVYTSSSAEVTSKAEIMKEFEAAAASTPADAEAAAAPGSAFTAEDIVVRPYGEAAAVTFRLVEHVAEGGKVHYRNSGMLLLREGRWQVVTWQATKVPVPAAAE